MTSSLAKKMQPKEKFTTIKPEDIVNLLNKNFFNLMSIFYETQSVYLSGMYKKLGSIETATILECFVQSMHLTIIRQRERNLNYDVSLKSFWKNLQAISKPSEKISSIVQTTSIPKETVRRKINNLLSAELLLTKKNAKGYYWNITPKEQDIFYNDIEKEIIILAQFTYVFAKNLNLNLSLKSIINEIKMQFSFYWYHFLTCELKWLKMWQDKLKDTDLLLIILQTIIPTLQYADKFSKNLNVENIFKIIGQADRKSINQISISAAAVSEVTGIPRATCIRKLNRLVLLGFLIRDSKTKRFYVNQNSVDRTSNVLTKNNVDLSIGIYSEFLSIILNSLLFNNNN